MHGNDAGDMMDFDMASGLLEMLGGEAQTVLTTVDVTSCSTRDQSGVWPGPHSPSRPPGFSLGDDADRGDPEVLPGKHLRLPRRKKHFARPWSEPSAYFSLMQKCLRTGFSIFHVPAKPGSTVNASPGRIVTGAPPSGVMVI